ncbi:MAG: DUF4238 domain-containing protein [Methylocella sp.]
MPAKRQHYIPRLHLRRFVGHDPIGHVWTYDSETGLVRSSIPENTALGSHFYSFEDGNGALNTGLEELLAEIEAIAAPVYEKLLTRKTISDQEKADFSHFLAAMYVRTPTMRRMMGDMLGRWIQIVNYGYAVHDGAFQTLTKGFEKEIGKTLSEEEKNTLRESMIDPSKFKFLIPKERTFPIEMIDKLWPILFDMNWSVLSPKHGYFITSDNPLIRNVDPKSVHKFFGDHGFLNKTAEISFPLSPKLMLVMAWSKKYPRQGVCGRGPVEFFNARRAADSERYLYAHICHKAVANLAATLKNSQRAMTTQGFGPDKFAKSEVPRRWQTRN